MIWFHIGAYNLKSFDGIYFNSTSREWDMWKEGMGVCLGEYGICTDWKIDQFCKYLCIYVLIWLDVQGEWMSKQM